MQAPQSSAGYDSIVQVSCAHNATAVVLLQVSEAAEQTALDICASEQTTEMLTQVWVTHQLSHSPQACNILLLLLLEIYTSLHSVTGRRVIAKGGPIQAAVQSRNQPLPAAQLQPCCSLLPSSTSVCTGG